jgi:hypothetical protein
MTPLAQICETLIDWLNDKNLIASKWSPEAWETFKFACRVHGVAPLLHQKLKTATWLEPSIKTWLAEQHTFNTQRVAKMQAELREILALFDHNNIRLMPLKGSILTASYYDEAGLRPMADLDLLIEPESLPRSIALLKQLGYQERVAHWKHIEFIKPDNQRVVSTEVEHPDNPRSLEVHLACRETFGGPTVDLTEQMWKNAARGELLGEKATIPKPEALWLHLVVHATYHIWQGRGRLIQLIDLARLSCHVDNDLGHLDNSLALLNTIDTRYSFPSLALVKRYFPANLADSVLAAHQACVSASFQTWVSGLDPVNSSYLSPEPAGLYLGKALRFTEGRPSEVLQALRFALLPGLAEIALDHPRLARSNVPWLAYFLLPVDWAKRLVGSK